MATGVILAGGRSSRMGRPKALLPVGGVPMVERVAASLAAVCRDLVVVADDPALAGGVRALVVGDEVPGQGPLAGLAAGLAAAPTDPCLVLACDMPFASPAVLGRMLEVAEGFDAVVPRWEEGAVEPLHALYRRSCLPAVRQALGRGLRRVDAFHPQVRVRYLEPAEWRPLDPEGRSWWNVNTPEDLEAAQAWT